MNRYECRVNVLFRLYLQCFKVLYKFLNSFVYVKSSRLSYLLVTGLKEESSDPLEIYHLRSYALHEMTPTRSS